MSWFGDIFKHMNLDLCLGGAGQRIDISASSGSRFGYNQGAMCNQFGNRGYAMQVDQNCYGYGRNYGSSYGSNYGSSYGSNYGSSYRDEIRQSEVLRRQEAAFFNGPTARTLGYGGYSGYGGGEGCFDRQRGGLSVDFNVGANSMRCDPAGRLAMMAGGFNYQNPGMGGGQPNINFSLRNIRLG